MSIDCAEAIHISDTHKTGLSRKSCLTQDWGAEQLSSGSALAKGDGPAGGRLAAAEEMLAQAAERNRFWLASLMEKRGSPMNTCLDAFILGEYLCNQLFQVLVWYHQSIRVICRGWVCSVSSAFAFIGD